MILKIYNLVILVITFFSLSTIASSVVEKNISIGVGSQILIDSKVLKENRSLLVSLPDGYTKSNNRYPVLYLLDGERHFNHSILATRLLNEQKRAPELIIVAIQNAEGARQRDFSFKKENFTLFLKNEVMAYVNKTYRTTGLNTLYGHSLTGYYTMNLLVSHPELFKNYIAASPPMQANDSEIYNKVLRIINAKDILDKSLYFTSANPAEEKKAVTQSINHFVKLLTEKSPEKLLWNYERLNDETHITGYYLTFFKGMTHVFKNYQTPNGHLAVLKYNKKINKD